MFSGTDPIQATSKTVFWMLLLTLTLASCAGSVDTSALPTQPSVISRSALAQIGIPVNQSGRQLKDRFAGIPTPAGSRSDCRRMVV